LNADHIYCLQWWGLAGLTYLLTPDIAARREHSDRMSRMSNPFSIVFAGAALALASSVSAQERTQSNDPTKGQLLRAITERADRLTMKFVEGKETAAPSSAKPQFCARATPLGVLTMAQCGFGSTASSR
jgi:hypothetical protein